MPFSKFFNTNFLNENLCSLRGEQWRTEGASMRVLLLRFFSGKHKMSSSVIVQETVANKSPNMALRILISKTKRSLPPLSREIC